MNGTLVSLSNIRTLKATTGAATASACSGGSGSGSGSGPGGCGSRTGGASMAASHPELDPQVWERIRDHPCYSEDAHHDFARIHVSVAPACNLQCNYCNRKYDCSNESRPGVVSEKLTPEQAVRKVIWAASRLPQLSVVGIAGPGDALANPRQTFRTFDLIRTALPHLKLCLSTNGLALPDHIETIKAFGIDHVTITINMVDPEIGTQIYPWLFFDHRRWTGRAAAELLHQRQMAGLEALTAAGILVKVNSVLIPGVNDEHLPAVNAAIKERGAFLHNVMPLISEPAHGTAFALAGQRGPTAIELNSLQERLSGTGVRLMRHCRQCRADAIGMLGESLDQEFPAEAIPDQPEYDPGAQQRYRALIAREQYDRLAARAGAERAIAALGRGTALRVAVATKGGGRINVHFGHAHEFLVYDADQDGIRLVGPRRVDQYCRGGWGEEDHLEQTLAALADVDLVLVSRIGDCPRERLEQAGLAVVDRHAYDYIEPAIAACFANRRTCDNSAGVGVPVPACGDVDGVAGVDVRVDFGEQRASA